jgi:hypothetical protein
MAFAGWGAVILFLAKYRQMSTQFSENGIFCGKFPKKFAKKRQKTGFLGMVSPPLCLLATVSEFLEINMPVKSKSA